MVIYTRFTVNGSIYNNNLGPVVDRGTDDYDGSSTFEVRFPNPHGQYANVFNIGDAVAIYVNQGSPVSGSPVAFFGGYLEDKEFDGPGDDTHETLKLSGRSYVSIMQDAIVTPVVYTNKTIEFMVKDMVNRDCPEIDTTNVLATGVTLPRMNFSGISIYDAVKQLGDLADAYFYVDPNKKLFFQLITTNSSGINLVAGQNVTGTTITETRKPMYNKVWVYGDNMLVQAPRKYLTANGGSVYQLDYRPYNTVVTDSGGTIAYNGGILNFVGQSDPGSGNQYLVNFNDMQIVFTSGTLAGNNIPASGTGKFVVDYWRQRQIIKYGQDDSSVALYKPKTYFYTDRNIKDPNQAKSMVLSLLDNGAHPFKQIDTDYKGWADVTPGATAGVYEPYQEVSGAGFNIIKATYTFTPPELQSEQVLKLTLNKKLIDGSDIIKQALLDIKRLRAQDILTNDLYTRMQIVNGSAGVKTASWFVDTRTLGSSFILNHPTWGVLGVQGTQPYLGDSRGAKTVVRSGAD